MRDNPAYDQIIQGLSGIMSITGTPETAPLRVGYPVADTLGGLVGAFAIAAALVRQKTSGEGAFLDVSMLECTLSALGWPVSNYLTAGVDPQPMGNENMTAAPSGAFRTGDGLLNIAANKQEQFVTLCRLIGLPELASDPRFAERETRKHNRAALKALIEDSPGERLGRCLGRKAQPRRRAGGPGADDPAGAGGAPSDRARHDDPLPGSARHGPAADRRARRLHGRWRGTLADPAAAGAGRAYGRGLCQPAAARRSEGAGMSGAEKKTGRERGEEWWQTGIIEMRPGVIRLRGYEIQDLIGRVSFPGHDLADAARRTAERGARRRCSASRLGAAVDHGPQAPSIAIARMAITCGVGINSAMASAINVLGDVHGGAGEQALSFYGDIAAALDAGAALADAVSARLDRFFAEEKGYVPGLGHRFHPVDPRAPRLIEVTRDFAARGVSTGASPTLPKRSRPRSRGARARRYRSTSMAPPPSSMANSAFRRR